MISNIIISVFSIALFFDFFANIFSMKRRKEAFRGALQEAEKKNGVLADTFQKILHNEFNGVKDLIRGLEQHSRLSLPKEGIRRCYAALLRNGVHTRLFVHPVDTFEEMIETVNLEFPGWVVDSSAFANIYVPKAELAPPPPQEPKISTYINDLSYVRDNFSEQPSEKKLIDSLIRRIKKHHGYSTSGSSN